MITSFLDSAKMPSRAQEQKVFDNLIGSWFGGLPKWGAEVNATEQRMLVAESTALGAAVSATSSAQIATTAATDAASVAGVEAWVSGKSYPKNAAAISQVNFQTYRRRAAGTTTVDPANDSTNWVMLTGDGAFIPQQLGLATSVNLALGNFFTKTLTGNQTVSFDNCPSDGFSFTFELTVTSGILTLPTSVRTPDDVPYTLTAGKVHELMFVTSNRGARWRLAAATNYAI